MALKFLRREPRETVVLVTVDTPDHSPVVEVTPPVEAPRRTPTQVVANVIRERCDPYVWVSLAVRDIINELNEQYQGEIVFHVTRYTNSPNDGPSLSLGIRSPSQGKHLASIFYTGTVRFGGGRAESFSFGNRMELRHALAAVIENKASDVAQIIDDSRFARIFTNGETPTAPEESVAQPDIEQAEPTDHPKPTEVQW